MKLEVNTLITLFHHSLKNIEYGYSKLRKDTKPVPTEQQMKKEALLSLCYWGCYHPSLYIPSDCFLPPLKPEPPQPPSLIEEKDTCFIDDCDGYVSRTSAEFKAQMNKEARANYANAKIAYPINWGRWTENLKDYHKHLEHNTQVIEEFFKKVNIPLQGTALATIREFFFERNASFDLRRFYPKLT